MTGGIKSGIFNFSSIYTRFFAGLKISANLNPFFTLLRHFSIKSVLYTKKIISCFFSDTTDKSDFQNFFGRGGVDPIIFFRKKVKKPYFGPKKAFFSYFFRKNRFFTRFYAELLTFLC